MRSGFFFANIYDFLSTSLRRLCVGTAIKIASASQANSKSDVTHNDVGNGQFGKRSLFSRSCENAVTCFGFLPHNVIEFSPVDSDIAKAVPNAPLPRTEIFML
jgi:hypothetical protein